MAAITGFSFSSVVNLKRLGVPADDISNILMADHGLQLYSNAVLVNTEFAEANPEIVQGFLRAVAMGWKDAAADPDGAIASLLERNPAADAGLETERFQMALDQNVMTEFVAENGMGQIDASRMDAALVQLGETYEFQNAPDAALYFTDAYLPEGGFSLK